MIEDEPIEVGGSIRPAVDNYSYTTATIRHPDGSVYERGAPPFGTLNRLHSLCEEVCPCRGTGPSIGRWHDKATWKFVADPEATPEQIAAAEAVMASFDPWGWDVPESLDIAEVASGGGGGLADFLDHYPIEETGDDLDALKEALRLRILAEAVRRSGMSMELFERINEVHKVIADPNSTSSAVQDAENELLMHGVWSERAKVIDAAKTQKLVEVMGLETLVEINAYDVNAGWP